MECLCLYLHSGANNSSLFNLDQVRGFLYVVKCHKNLRWYYYYLPSGAFICISYTKFPSLLRPKETLSVVLFVPDPQGDRRLPEVPLLRTECAGGSIPFSRDCQKQNPLSWSEHNLTYDKTWYNVIASTDPVSGQTVFQPTSCPGALQYKGDLTMDHTPVWL